ncbi:hypothetical protein [Streptomyces sp. NPDC048411]|uniref:hypothetical protein n=1 Tax=Streptomyces sp. NPDC048411 TaxID=3157206 RepID=UPI003451AA46
MNLRRTVVGVALAAIALTATGVPTASGAEASPHPGRSHLASHTTAGTPHPGPDKSDWPKKGDTKVPTLPSAPLKGLPTLREARQKGLLSQPMSAAGGVTTQAFPDYSCTTPPQGWGYHDYLSPGECLTQGTYIAVNIDPTGWYELWMQSDGNVVLYFHDGLLGYRAKWQTGTRAWNPCLEPVAVDAAGRQRRPLRRRGQPDMGHGHERVRRSGGLAAGPGRHQPRPVHPRLDADLGMVQRSLLPPLLSRPGAGARRAAER